jgi:plasmid replication initiation protein
MTSQLTVYKSNQIIEASYRLSLNEQRVILACIGQVKSAEKLLVTDKFELSAKDFAKLFSISEDRAYSELQSIAKTLYQRSVTVHNPDTSRPKLKKLETRWISSIGYMPEEGKIILCFAQDMLPYLSELKGQFTRYELKHIGNMTSLYGIRVYELLMQWKTTGKREIEIDWLKQQFEIENKYPSIKDLKKYVIDPAVKDINTHSNYQVSWTQRKTGRNVTHLIFEFSEKKAEKPKTKKADTQNTAVLFQELTDKQIDLFSSKLANDSGFGSKYARIGEELHEFVQRLKQELRDPKKQALYLPYLKKHGFKIASPKK